MLSLGVGCKPWPTIASPSPVSSTPSSSPRVVSFAALAATASSQNFRPPEKFKPLDDDARQTSRNYPTSPTSTRKIRFFTDVRFDNNTYSTNVLGVPESSAPPAPSTASSANIFLPPPPKKPSSNKTSPKISPPSPPA